MSKVYFLKGLPASGKSTWAKERLAALNLGGKVRAVRANKDEIRIELGVKGGNKEGKVIKRETEIVTEAMKAGLDVIVDNTHFNPIHERRYRALAEEYGYEFEIVSFTDTPLEECIRRDQNRPNYVGEKVIRSMYNKFLKPKPEEYRFDPNLPTALICDLDGTLAEIVDRSPYDPKKCMNDKVREVVQRVVYALYNSGTVQHVLFVSGRTDDSKWESIQWLMEVAGFDYDDDRVRLFMRKTGDVRDDGIVKREIFDAEIRGKYQVLVVLDDRNRVVETWRQMGLEVFQVAPGDF